MNGQDLNIHVASSPHISDKSFTTQGMMKDVLIALLPLIIMSIYIFKVSALKQIFICVAACIAAEALFVKMRGQAHTLHDFSAVITGIILALSLPGTAPWYVGFIASFVAIGIGKVIFGGLGMNIFNPAMVGRAFVMIAFASVMGAGAYEDPSSLVDIITQATPLTLAKQSGVAISIKDLFWGMTNGSLGETSAIACLIGGIYLCVKKTASWEIPVSIIGTVLVIAGIADIAGPCSGQILLHHLFGGALMFGAFFIATDPVSSPLSFKGKVIFGIGMGILIMVIRLFSGYPEGVMFAVLMMNSVTPLINRWTIPTPMGAA